MENLQYCPICEEKTFNNFLQANDYSISQEQFTLVECANCGFVLTNPRPDEGQIGRYYKSDIYISHHANKGGLIPWVYRKIRDRQFVNKTDLIRSFFSNTPSILDIGCGTGNFLNYCKSFGWATTGVEPDTEARDQALAKQLRILDLDYLRTTSDTFDVITLWHVLEHVHDLKERMEQLVRLLNPGGIIIVAVPNLKAFDATHYKQYWAAYDLPRHLSHFSKDTIKRLFNRFGFHNVKIAPMKYDAFYVSLKSEEYIKKNLFLNLFFGLVRGLKSNLLAKKNQEYSSLIYVFKK